MREEMKERDLTAFCGLYCGDCIRYQSKSSDLANDLLKELDNQRFSEYAKVKKIHVKEFEDFELLISSLRGIADLKCEIPCRLGGDGCIASCEVIKCIKAKSYEGCWECPIFESCKKFDFLRPFHGDAPLKNLRMIREYGLEGWARHREKFYPWL